MINWKIRIRSKQFWLGIIGLIGTVVSAMGMRLEDIATWQGLGDLIVKMVSNPFLIISLAFSVLCFVGVIVDPTTEGLGDSKRALGYKRLGGADKGQANGHAND